jgi:Kef-type K+ transport system membrane component KefB
LSSAADAGAHGDPVAPVVLAVAVFLVAAKAGGELASRLGQPAVLGELLAGVVLGNLTLLGITTFEPFETNPFISVLAGIGVLLLLFEVGLESTVAEMLSVGASAFLVAVLGVLAPFGLGWLVGAWLLPGESAYVHAFIGATLCATSVGITARVLQDLGWSRSQEARIILGAAVIDDVLGLVILAAVSGAIGAAAAGAPFSFGALAKITLAAVVFLIASLAIGVTAAPRLFAAASVLQTRGVLLTLGLSLCFVLAWLSNAIGLAPIVGAFAAGLILEHVHYRDFVTKGERPLEELIRPLTDFLVPLFFVLMGLRTDLRAFLEPGVFGLAMALIVAAVLGKQVCSLGILTSGVDRLSVGLGMVPRGEVGLIFANVGLGLSLNGEPIISGSTFSAVVAMVIVTTVVTPPALKWSLQRRARQLATRSADDSEPASTVE